MKTAINWKAYALALLCIFTAATASLSSATMCKYTASATVSASAKVAKWAHTWSGVHSDNAVARTYSWMLSSSVYREETDEIKFTVKNDSEVGANYTPYIFYYDTNGVSRRDVTTGDSILSSTASTSYPYVTFTCTGGTVVTAGKKWFASPGQTLNFTAKITCSESLWDNFSYRCRAFVYAEQVD